MKRVILVAAAAVMLFTHSLAQAQEREPLVMRIELEWTVAWTVIGAGVGGALWLTDPGNPHNHLTVSLAEGAAIGAVVGAAFGIYVIQRNAQLPGTASTYDPLDPMNRPGRDIVAAQLRREDLLASLEHPPSGGRREWEIPLASFNWRF